MHDIRKEISKIPAIKKTLAKISKNMEIQNQMMLRIMESTTQDRSTMSEKLTELTMRNSMAKDARECKGSSKRENEMERVEKKIEDESGSDRNKFKKIEMPIFNGDDPDSWLFCAEIYFQIHKLTEFEKLTVSTISYKGPTLNWYLSQEEREKL